MLAADEPTWSSGQSLAGFHGARSILYLCVWRLFSNECRASEATNLRALIQTGASTLGDPECWLALRDMLTDSGQECERARAWAQDFACQTPNAPDRVRIHQAVGLGYSDNPAQEAHALGLLAQEASAALTGSDLPRAAEVDEWQVRLLETHAAKCLQRVAQSLELENDIFLQTLGRAVAWLISNDLSLLDASSARAS